MTWWLYVLECQGGVLYTGIAKEPQWHYLPPIPTREEAQLEEEGEDER